MYGLIEWSLAALRTNGIDPRKTELFDKILSGFTIVCNAIVMVITGLELLLNWNGVKTVAKVEALPNTMLATFQAFHIIFQLYPVIMGFDGLYMGLITTIYVQLELIKHAFLEISYKNRGPEKHKFLREVIIHHNFILNYIKLINSIYTRMLFIKYWTMLVAVTFSLYMITRNGFPPDGYMLLKYGPYCANLLIQFGLYCMSGAILNTQVVSVSNAVYEIDWWMKGETKIRKSLAFVIQRSQRIDRLTIGKMYDLNLVSYMKLLKNVMSIYTLLDKLSTPR
ncbi:PREDICTED: odorant receptor 22c-like [Nicrophorus vespilloides]|uniref:Odorant receptor 22c-like n=1 Tax=Nicrophorus vespilloides TaxID=110193 RepID=A0ABM1NDC5_NICVS|nr:PREDICTED: odorant receptor 22c-like [Nicrophorus vespilloides]